MEAVFDETPVMFVYRLRVSVVFMWTVAGSAVSVVWKTGNACVCTDGFENKFDSGNFKFCHMHAAV